MSDGVSLFVRGTPFVVFAPVHVSRETLFLEAENMCCATEGLVVRAVATAKYAN